MLFMIFIIFSVLFSSLREGIVFLAIGGGKFQLSSGTNQLAVCLSLFRLQIFPRVAVFRMVGLHIDGAYYVEHREPPPIILFVPQGTNLIIFIKPY